jgi:hypothetical protein
MLRPHTEDRLTQVQAALDEELRASQPEVRNLSATGALFGSDTLEYRGRRYEVPPVPFALGVALLELQERAGRLQGDVADPAAELGAILTGAVEIFPRLVRPTGWRRLVWPLLPNPFRAASEYEVGELIGFFSGCRMRSRVRHPSPRTSPHPPQTS